jgi:hypothetical protein
MRRVSDRRRRFSPPRQVRSRGHRRDSGSGGPFQRAACGGFGRRSRNASAQVAVGPGSRYAGGMAGDQIGGREPGGQRLVAALHDRTDSQSCLTLVFAACRYPRAGHNAERLTHRTTKQTDEAVSSAAIPRYSAHATSSGKAAETPAATAETAARDAGRCPSKSARAFIFASPPQTFASSASAPMPSRFTPGS